MVIASSLRLGLLRGAGLLLITLGIVHLVATPHITTLIQQSASAESVSRLTPPMLLNHVLVGVLLLPLGFLTLYAAPHAVNGATWARVVVRTTALAVATLPLALFAFMGTRYYLDAPLFVVGAALAVIVAVTMLVVAFARWSRPDPSISKTKLQTRLRSIYQTRPERLQ
jgi:hypothetical protein